MDDWSSLDLLWQFGRGPSLRCIGKRDEDLLIEPVEARVISPQLVFARQEPALFGFDDDPRPWGRQLNVGSPSRDDLFQSDGHVLGLGLDAYVPQQLV
ncbi:hypothetical protein EFL95_05180 [Nocardioides marmorisolisilvae]|uniref:Uncharacterized protein n=1 Tax=Nocardioides marmorisolisilvae TaxID=1542737 RepID=A0A3N0DS96_9ACTN|nr:hypothetical protein EFL95_05180 [Nocardioides marmorisolisilvae]